uniref:Amphi-Trp domain-containing protein n=1 Tax=Thermocrispum agreste TaxID=37925 RepID=A0A2W4JA59_9PSEU|nr:MAG: hypothetical protein DIU77_13205 [Thermocrispum agreste]
MELFEDARMVTRAELAAWLRQVADQVDRGQVFYGAAGMVTVADRVHCELEVERDGSELSFEIEFSWPAAQPEAEAAPGGAGSDDAGSDDEDEDDEDTDEAGGEADADDEEDADADEAQEPSSEGETKSAQPGAVPDSVEEALEKAAAAAPDSGSAPVGTGDSGTGTDSGFKGEVSV